MKLYVATKAFVEYDGKILILRESKNYVEGTYAGKWDVIGGRIDPEESIFDALVREVKEECGIDVSVEEQFLVAEQFQEIAGDQCHVIRLYFTCKAPTASVRVSNDHETYQWIDPKTHREYSFIPDVHDAFDTYIKKFY